jgi:multiple sugar transport system substrate-binding protein
MARISRRTFLKGAASVAGAAAFSPLLSSPGWSQGKTIVYWGHNYPSRVKIINEIMAPGFKRDAGIQVDHSVFDTNQMEPKILTAWAGGGEGPDLVSVGDYNLANYVYRKMAAPVDPVAMGFKNLDALLAAYEPNALDGLMVDGKLYAIPMDHGSISMVYRKDFFKEAGLDPESPPKTWESLVEAALKLTRRDASGKVTRAGLGWEARSISSHFYYWGTLLPQKGVDFLSADGKRNGFNSASGMAAFQYLYDTFHTWRIAALGLAPTISPIDDFGAGRVAMMNTGFWLPPSMEEKYPNISFAKGVYGVMRLPQFAGGKPATRLNPWVWMVSARSRLQKETWQFVSYMTKDPKNQHIWATQAQYLQPWKGMKNRQEITALPYAKVFLEDLAIGVPTPRTVKYAELATNVAKAYDRISANGEKPEVVVPDLARQVDRLLSE